MVGSQIVLPEKGEVMKFENHNYKFRHPLVIYGDTEATNLGTKDEMRRVHRANSYGFYIVSDLDAIPSKYCSYVGEDAAEQLLRHLFSIEEEVNKLIKDINGTLSL